MVWKRITNLARNLWRMTEKPDVLFSDNSGKVSIGFTKAEFIFPDRVKEIMERKADASIDDVITK